MYLELNFQIGKILWQSWSVHLKNNDILLCKGITDNVKIQRYYVRKDKLSRRLYTSVFEIALGFRGGMSAISEGVRFFQWPGKVGVKSLEL